MAKLLNSKYVVFAEQGRSEALQPEKYKQGYTGQPSDYAIATNINNLFQQTDKRFNETNALVNLCALQGILTYEALFEYPKDSIVTFQGRLYRSRNPVSGTPPQKGDSTDQHWELIPASDYLKEQLDLKANLESPNLTGKPTTTTPDGTNLKQVENVEHTLSLIEERIRGKSTIDLTAYEANKAVPVMFCVDNLPTKSYISRVQDEPSQGQGSMRLTIEGIGAGNNNKNANYLKVININGGSGDNLSKFVKRIETKAGNPYIIVWLRGKTIYNLDQRFPEKLPQIVTSQKNLENNWIVNIEAWDDNSFIRDGVWSYTKTNDITIDYTSLSDTGEKDSCGTLVFTFHSEKPLGSLVADGSAVSRTTYAKLFSIIGVRYGAGDGINTFNLPDMRGLVPKGIDLGKNLDSNQLVTAASGGSDNRTTKEGIGSTQSGAIQNITGEIALMDDDAWNQHSTTYNSMYNISAWYPTDNAGAFGIKRQSTEDATISYGSNAQYTTGINAGGAGKSVREYLGNIATFDSSKIVPTASKNQVDNMALLACIYFV